MFSKIFHSTFIKMDTGNGRQTCQIGAIKRKLRAVKKDLFMKSKFKKRNIKNNWKCRKLNGRERM